MCGITGIVAGSDGQSVETERLRMMCRSLRHRGPDDEGVYVRGRVGLAMRRLAVIDVAGGRQPVANEAGTVHAVFNGEIYNHQSLRRELARRGHRFASGSDSEVIAHLYEEHGVDFADRLEGMFAIALWDDARRRLVLSRDRVGIKPLYYAPYGRGLVFGSEIKAILAAGVKTTLDVQALSSYLSLMYIPGPRSIYAEIRKLEPGTTLVWHDDTYDIRRYWDLAAVGQRDDVSPAEARRLVRATLLDSVEQQLQADVPLGFFLSAGMDSSSVVAAARRIHPDGVLKTFTVGFADRTYDERSLAALVARRLRTDHVELVVEPRAEDVTDRILPSFDEPFADPSAVPSYYLCELARAHVTVAVSGDGGDELFAGYLTYQADKLARHYRHLPRDLVARLPPAMLRRLPASDARMSFGFKARRFVDNALEDPGRSHYLWRVVFREAHKAELLEPDIVAELTDSYETHESHYRNGMSFDPLTRFQYTDFNVYLAEDVLAKVDRLSMAHSLEVRVPLLATSMIEFAFSLPGGLKMPGYRPKQLLRQAMVDILPAEITRMRKKGFNAPLSRWLRQVFRPLVGEYLSRETLRRQGYFRFDRVDEIVRSHLNGTAEHSREIWTLLMFSLWAEQEKVYR
ncbi:asparagine synthase (glutamine-hydrolyzing) [Planosporangium flavigriseum]|uniref:asparagine synthase (glutamine-hydrolyzing) n=1 Tax=Planosporangium flavigriseum TaxID=373681 RepID=A0A8J3PN45_9ACTN|nr:asparagine synthase (glutamine-hydrolyzing) [Planosporangium flavigriseum]NJC65880.1 asparagine synthase (glutamine-hydrolyzing) [Planosporangium flavigriseum]GIG75587.1 asparagine synthetase B [Planosporangium flavigriseum]